MSEREDEQDNLPRMIEALLFASPEPLRIKDMQDALREAAAETLSAAQVKAALRRLEEEYQPRGVNLLRRGEAYALRTAADLSRLFRREKTEIKPLSRAARETLAIIAYHQPISRAEIEDIRGVETAKGTLDILLEAGWAVIKGRRDTPGRPLIYGTSAAFLDYFNLPDLSALPGLKELRAMGFLTAAAGENDKNDEKNGADAA